MTNCQRFVIQLTSLPVNQQEKGEASWIPGTVATPYPYIERGQNRPIQTLLERLPNVSCQECVYIHIYILDR